MAFLDHASYPVLSKVASLKMIETLLTGLQKCYSLSASELALPAATASSTHQFGEGVLGGGVPRASKWMSMHLPRPQSVHSLSNITEISVPALREPVCHLFRGGNAMMNCPFSDCKATDQCPV